MCFSIQSIVGKIIWFIYLIFYSFTISNVKIYSIHQESDSSGISRVFAFMVPMTLLTFLPCYYGNELSVASEKIPIAFFHSKWFMNDSKFRKTALIFMENVKQTMKIDSYGLFIANLNSFTSMINSSYSLFAVLKKMNSK